MSADKYETRVLEDGSTKEFPPGADHFALVWKDLRVTVKKNGKVLLKDIAGCITTGLYAVMGPSGSGKTTLLNSLAYRLDSAVKMTGPIHMNGQTYCQRDLKAMAGYVMQDDLLVATMSVQETLEFTARLRLPATFTREQRTARVEEGLLAMGITECRDVYIGNELSKGISGGERKRVCVAQELLTKPVLLFLDEPTSGLDSVTALLLCQKLRILADNKACTVVSTIHQPQAKIFNLFTNLLLLKDGSILYQGMASDCEGYFSKLGSSLELHENPADHFMDAMSGEDFTQKLLEAYVAPEVDLNMYSDRPVATTRNQVSWGTQFLTCLGRTLKDSWRNRTNLYLNLFQSCAVAFFIGLLFLKMGRTNASQVKRRNLLFLVALNQGVCGAFLTINTFPPERALMLRERANGMYRSSAYFLAKQFGDVGQFVCPWVFSCICYFMIGLNDNTASKFFIFGAFMMLANVSAVSLAMAVSSIARTTDFAFTLLPFAFEVARNFCSFFLPPAILPKYYRWLDAMSYLKYPLTAITINEHWGLKYSDPPVRNATTGLVIRGGPFTEGKEALAGAIGYWTPKGGFDLTIGQCAGWSILYIFVARFAAYLGVRYVKW